MRLVRVNRASTKCTECGECVTTCQLGLVPMRDIFGNECDNCGLCISNCDDEALDFNFWRKTTDSDSAIIMDKNVQKGIQDDSV